MVNFGPLAAEIDPVVWGTPANFNRFHVWAALMHSTPVIPVLGISQTAALNRGHHLYSAGRPSRWASAHILVTYVFAVLLPDLSRLSCRSIQGMFLKMNTRHQAIGEVCGEEEGVGGLSFPNAESWMM